MTDKRVSRDSVELVGVRVTATTVAGTARDPIALGYTVALAVLPEATVDPETTDFKAAIWQTGARGLYAVAMVGTGSSIGVLAAGNYRVWAKVTAGTETPVMRSTHRLVVY
jgi:hypothetical protein